MGDFHLHIASTLGLLLGVCLAAGLFADVLHLPKVTAYLLVGLLVGPSVLDLIPEGHVELFEPVLKLAMAVVLFNLGCEFTFTKVRRVAAHCLALSAAEIATPRLASERRSFSRALERRRVTVVRGHPVSSAISSWVFPQK